MGKFKFKRHITLFSALLALCLLWVFITACDAGDSSIPIARRIGRLAAASLGAVTSYVMFRKSMKDDEGWLR